MINYYVDPGSGFIFTQNISFLWGIILAFISAFFIFFRIFFKKFLWILLIVLVAVIIGGIIMHNPRKTKKVIILGIDAMDPKITEHLMQEGRLPNLLYLKNEGSYSHLATTVSCETAVVWSSFATGLDPSGHGIFDFVMRNPKNYSLYLSLNEISNIGGKIKIQLRRKGKCFWEILSRNKVPSYIYFCPNTFPPDKVFGVMLSGMGVPDITGTMGKYTFYTSEMLQKIEGERRGRIVNVEINGKTISTYLYGPNILSKGIPTESRTVLYIIIDTDKKGIILKFEGNEFFLKQGQWSEWQKVYFKIGNFRNAYGIVRFYLNSIYPYFQLYASPINFDPEKPLFPISYPNNHSRIVASEIGLYHTQGMPCDTWVLTEGRLDEKAFLEQVNQVFEERQNILNEELKRFNNGLFFFYFDILDVVQHMFWRYLDAIHPLYEENSPYKDVIYGYYQKIDALIGKILKQIDKNTILIILSDHGFGPFRKAVHLNRWLMENGYLFLKEGFSESEDFFSNVDWSRTRAYALGFGGIYLNKIGREGYGIVDESEAIGLKQEIIMKLLAFKDPQTQEKIIKDIYDMDKIYNGRFMAKGPDLFVGFNSGYRASWQTALGGTPDSLIEYNKKKWSGDHLVDPTLVPGVIFLNRKLKLQSPNIIDLAPTILSIFNINYRRWMNGKSLFEDKLDN